MLLIMLIMVSWGGGEEWQDVGHYLIHTFFIYIAIPGNVLQKLVASKTGKRMVSVDGVALPQGAGSKEQPIYVIAEEGMI